MKFFAFLMNKRFIVPWNKVNFPIAGINVACMCVAVLHERGCTRCSSGNVWELRSDAFLLLTWITYNLGNVRTIICNIAVIRLSICEASSKMQKYIAEDISNICAIVSIQNFDISLNYCVANFTKNCVLDTF